MARRLLAARYRGRAPAWRRPHDDRVGEAARRLHFRLAPIGPFALEALIEGPVGARLATARAWTGFGLAALAAALVNPYGVDALILPFRLIVVEGLSRISEWRPQDFSRPERWSSRS